MDSSTSNSNAVQPAENTRKSSGNPAANFRKRLAASCLSDRFRQRVFELMIVHESADRVADVLRAEMPGLTGKTVLEVMVLALVRPPQREERGGLLAIRRTA